MSERLTKKYIREELVKCWESRPEKPKNLKANAIEELKLAELVLNTGNDNCFSACKEIISYYNDFDYMEVKLQLAKTCFLRLQIGYENIKDKKTLNAWADYVYVLAKALSCKKRKEDLE